MKIEIGESLMRSWLRHVRGCQTAELNWKPSSFWDYADCQALMDEARAFFLTNLNMDIFKETQTSAQFLLQAELDVLGIKMDKSGAVDRIIAVDIAFHEGGLNYKGKENTVATVLKKVMRAAMVARAYFATAPAELVFASPTVTPGYTTALNAAFEHLTQFIKTNCPHMDCRLLLNDDFRDEIITPVLAASDEVADTSELFLRSYGMLKLFKIAEKESKTESTPGSVTQIRSANNETLPIELEPGDVNAFRQRLLVSKAATIEVFYNDGTSDKKLWNAEKFSENSNVLGNLRSRPEFRQGNWQKQGISKIKVKAA